MQIDYSEIFEQIATIIGYTLPISIGIGLCERVISMVLDAALDRFAKRERL